MTNSAATTVLADPNEPPGPRCTGSDRLACSHASRRIVEDEREISWGMRGPLSRRAARDTSKLVLCFAFLVLVLAFFLSDSLRLPSFFSLSLLPFLLAIGRGMILFFPPDDPMPGQPKQPNLGAGCDRAERQCEGRDELTSNTDAGCQDCAMESGL